MCSDHLGSQCACDLFAFEHNFLIIKCCCFAFTISEKNSIYKVKVSFSAIPCCAYVCLERTYCCEEKMIRPQNMGHNPFVRPPLSSIASSSAIFGWKLYLWIRFPFPLWPDISKILLFHSNVTHNLRWKFQLASCASNEILRHCVE